MPIFPDEFADLVRSLTHLIVNEESLEDTLRRVAYLAVESPIGADNAGVTLQRGARPATAAFYGDAALGLDRAQYESDHGPCLTAFRTGEMIRLDTIATESNRWPDFAAEAAEHSIGSSLSLPLIVNGETVGALNLYANTLAPPFSDHSLELAEAFAQQAAIAVANAEIYWRTHELTEHLAKALENRDRIGQAKGVLIARENIGADAAFDRLRSISQKLNIKLRDVADYVIRTGELPTGALPTDAR